MKSREIFEEIRNQKDQIFGLRMRLSLLVAAELVICILLSIGANSLFTRMSSTAGAAECRNYCVRFDLLLYCYKSYFKMVFRSDKEDGKGNGENR